jgi:glutamate-ammonia-ligase adenylyltransferase
VSRATSTLTELARLGFAGLGQAAERLEQIPDELEPARLAPLFALAADPDQALRLLLGLIESAPVETAAVLADAADGDPGSAAALVRVLGASEGLASFLGRHPDHLDALRHPIADPGDLGAVASSGSGEPAWNVLRVSYRHELLRLAAWDLGQPDPAAVVDRVASALADLAGAALDASLAAARAASGDDAPPLALIGMGK